MLLLIWLSLTEPNNTASLAVCQVKKRKKMKKSIECAEAIMRILEKEDTETARAALKIAESLLDYRISVYLKDRIGQLSGPSAFRQST